MDHYQSLFSIYVSIYHNIYYIIVLALSSSIFQTVMCKLEGKRWKEAVAETRQKFLTTYEVAYINIIA